MKHKRCAPLFVLLAVHNMSVLVLSDSASDQMAADLAERKLFKSLRLENWEISQGFSMNTALSSARCFGVRRFH